MPRMPKPNGPPHGGMDFDKSEPNPDTPRATFVLARRLVPGDRIMIRCERDGMTFDEDRIVKGAIRERDRVYIKLEPKPDAQSSFDVTLDHRFVAVDAANPIKIKGR